MGTGHVGGLSSLPFLFSMKSNTYSKQSIINKIITVFDTQSKIIASKPQA